MEFGSQNGPLELAGVAVPVSQEDVLSIGGFHQCQKPSQQLGVGWSLDGLIGLEIDRNDKDGPGLGFPEEGLVATSFNVEVLQLSDSMVIGVEDEDAAMVAFIGAVGVGRQAESMFASYFEVLTHRVVFLLVEMCLHQDVDVIVSAP